MSINRCEPGDLLIDERLSQGNEHAISDILFKITVSSFQDSTQYVWVRGDLADARLSPVMTSGLIAGAVIASSAR